MTYLKKIVGTKSLHTKHCASGISPRIIPPVSPFLSNPPSFDVALLPTLGVDCLPLPPKL